MGVSVYAAIRIRGITTCGAFISPTTIKAGVFLVFNVSGNFESPPDVTIAINVLATNFEKKADEKDESHTKII